MLHGASVAPGLPQLVAQPRCSVPRLLGKERCVLPVRVVTPLAAPGADSSSMGEGVYMLAYVAVLFLVKRGLRVLR